MINKFNYYCISNSNCVPVICSLIMTLPWILVEMDHCFAFLDLSNSQSISNSFVRLISFLSWLDFWKNPNKLPWSLMDQKLICLSSSEKDTTVSESLRNLMQSTLFLCFSKTLKTWDILRSYTITSPFQLDRQKSCCS